MRIPMFDSVGIQIRIDASGGLLKNWNCGGFVSREVEFAFYARAFETSESRGACLLRGRGFAFRMRELLICPKKLEFYSSPG